MHKSPPPIVTLDKKSRESIDMLTRAVRELTAIMKRDSRRSQPEEGLTWGPMRVTGSYSGTTARPVGILHESAEFPSSFARGAVNHGGHEETRPVDIGDDVSHTQGCATGDHCECDWLTDK